MTDEMVDLFVFARELRRDAFAMILTQRDKEEIEKRLTARGFAATDFYVDSVRPADVPSYLGAADAAVSFIKACYSKQSSSPTKMAEYLAGGLPIIANTGVGDVDALLSSYKVGILLDDFTESGIKRALEQVSELGDIRERCKETARSVFDLSVVAGVRYRRLYRSLEGNGE